MFKKLTFLCVSGLVLTLLPACQKSPEEARDDLQDAEQRAYENVREEQADVEAERREAADEIRAEQRDVEDAAAEGAADVQTERQEVEEADRNAEPNP